MADSTRKDPTLINRTGRAVTVKAAEVSKLLAKGYTYPSDPAKAAASARSEQLAPPAGAVDAELSRPTLPPIKLEGDETNPRRTGGGLTGAHGPGTEAPTTGSSAGTTTEPIPTTESMLTKGNLETLRDQAGTYGISTDNSWSKTKIVDAILEAQKKV